MTFTETAINGAFIIEVHQIKDDRGFFGRSFCQKEFERFGLNGNMVQTNVSSNPKSGTLRGLHMQVSPFSEAKLVRCTKGSVFDVMVDMRVDSPTFKKWFGIELTEENFRMLYIPEGCAHGYLTLQDKSDVTYQVSQYYTPAAERGFLWNDPAFEIAWPIAPELISVKDQSHPLFESETYNQSAEVQITLG